MWTLGPALLPGPLAGAAHLAAVGLIAWLQELGHRLRQDRPRSRWSGTGRDLLNVAGLAALAVTLRAVGFPGPAALVAAAAETLLLFGACAEATRRGARHRRAWTAAAGLLVAAPAVLRPGEVVALLGASAAWLFPG